MLMDSATGALTLALTAACAFAMGVAIQRGSTCTVAALQEVANTGRPTKLLAMLEAAAWVAVGLMVARAAGALPPMPTAFALHAGAWAGAALLGLGALLNNACVIGTVARVGSGEWVYLSTPLGFYAGCVGAQAWLNLPTPAATATPAPLLQAPAWLAGVLVLAASARLAWAMHRHRSRWSAWTPHASTAAIGVAFVLIWLLAGAWAYTDVLAEVARGMARSVPARVLLGAVLFAGAWWGGRRAAAMRPPMPWRWATLAKCFLGGALMGVGSLLIPGSHDSLVLLGLPLLWPAAWAVYLTMALVMLLTIWLQKSLGTVLSWKVGGRLRP